MLRLSVRSFQRVHHIFPHRTQLLQLPFLGLESSCHPPTLGRLDSKIIINCSSVSFFHVEICFSFALGFHPDVPSYPFDEKFDNFAFNCLLTREEAIVAMAKVRSECNKVASMSVFQVPVSKSMKLEEFEQTQAQVSTQVSTQLNISKINITRM